MCGIFPGGNQETGETVIDCAIREVREEIALEVSELEEIYSNKLVFAGEEWEAHFYFASTAKGKPTLNELNKIKGIQFIDDLNSVDFSSDLDPLFNYLGENNKVTKWI